MIEDLKSMTFQALKKKFNFQEITLKKTISQQIFF